MTISRVVLAAVLALVAASWARIVATAGDGAVQSCSPKNSIGYTSRERCEVCDEDGCSESASLAQSSQAAARRGETAKAIAILEKAVQTENSTKQGRVQRWDNLAELYCLHAGEMSDRDKAAELRKKGLALLAEFRCGVNVLTRKTACALSGLDVGKRRGEEKPWGRVPNPALSPLCYKEVCQAGFQDDDEPWEGDFDGFQDEYPGGLERDADNVGDIESLCRGGAK